MDRRGFLQTVAGVGAVSAALAPPARGQESRKALKIDLHTHYYPEAYFQKIRDTPGEFAFDKDPTGRTIIKYRGARFFGIQPPMTDPTLRLAAMDRVGIDVEVVSLSTPNVFFADEKTQPAAARMVNNAYAGHIARHPGRSNGRAP